MGAGPRPSSRLRSVAERAAAVALFVAAYFLLWRPLRLWIAHDLVAPALHALSPGLGGLYEFAAQPHAPIVAARPLEAGARAASWLLPGGMYFLLPGVFFVAYAPRRLYWLAFLGSLLALGLLSLAGFVVGCSGIESGFAWQRFVDQYLQRPMSLGAPLLLVYGHFAAPSAPTASEKDGIASTNV